MVSLGKGMVFSTFFFSHNILWPSFSRKELYIRTFQESGLGPFLVPVMKSRTSNKYEIRSRPGMAYWF